MLKIGDIVLCICNLGLESTDWSAHIGKFGIITDLIPSGNFPSLETAYNFKGNLIRVKYSDANDYHVPEELLFIK